MSGRTLAQWLDYQQQLHPDEIELGLDRVKQVWQQIESGNKPINCPVIVVGGTNGKGSTVAYLERIYLESGFSTLVYTSPHISRYNERIRLDGKCVDDRSLIRAFEQVEASRAGIDLTYFEFGTLAALYLACVNPPDILILEVGLGGRLDAVNILQHDVAIVTSIALDHMEWLGKDISAIAREKAGIARKDMPLITGDSEIPDSLYEQARAAGAQVLRIDRDFSLSRHANGWDYYSSSCSYRGLPLPAIPGAHQVNNAASAITAVNCLQDVLPVAEVNIRKALTNTGLQGRFERIGIEPPVYVDVAHNPAAATELHGILTELKGQGRLIAVLAMQSNRQIEPFIMPLRNDFDGWYVAPLANGSGHAAEAFESILKVQCPNVPVSKQASVSSAIHAVLKHAQPSDRIVVFGSFYTVAEARAAMHV